MRRPLSVGDALAIVALAAFASFWFIFVGWFLMDRLTGDEFEQGWWLYLLVWWGPGGFAGWLVYRIIDP